MLVSYRTLAAFTPDCIFGLCGRVLGHLAVALLQRSTDALIHAEKLIRIAGYLAAQPCSPQAHTTGTDDPQRLLRLDRKA